MNTITTLVGKTLTSLLLMTSSPALAESENADMNSSVRLICSDGAADPMCKALSDALRQTSKDVTVEVVEADHLKLPPVSTTLQFVPNLDTPDALSGHLKWKIASGESGVGPTLELSVMDAVRDQQILNTYALQLLQLSNIPCDC